MTIPILWVFSKDAVPVKYMSWGFPDALVKNLKEPWLYVIKSGTWYKFNIEVQNWVTPNMVDEVPKEYQLQLLLVQ